MWAAALGAGAALAALLALLALRACRAPRKPRSQVVVVRAPRPPRRPRAALPAHPHLYPPLPALPPRRTRDALIAAPADDDKAPPPQIIIVSNTNTQENRPGTSVEFKGPKLPLPEQWLLKKPFDYKYSTIPRPLVQLDAGPAAGPREARVKQFGATRSPSLEKDERSPRAVGAVGGAAFGFPAEPARDAGGADMERAAMSPRDADAGDSSPGALRRYRSVSTRLNACGAAEPPRPDGQQERLEMQNSPRLLDRSRDRSKFDFSPKLVADATSSPRFFTPPEATSPMFFAEPSPKSVYYDTVRSPKFFPETPRESEVPQSPRALGDHLNRNGHDKPSSPRILGGKPSPKIHSCNKENYFTFDSSLPEEGPARISPRPRRYGGRNSIEKERYTPPVDREAKKYRRHNSCDTNYRNIELNITKCEEREEARDVVDCCAKMKSLQIEREKEEKHEPAPGLTTAHARRQRLKSISLDSDNAKIIEQNLGLPIAKQLKDQMNEAYKNQDVSASCESMERHATPAAEQPVFKFEEEPAKDKTSEEDEPETPDLKKRSLRQSSDTQSFIDMPRFSPKEFEITVTTEEGATSAADSAKRRGKNLRNLTIDLTKRDSDLEKELLEFEKLYTNAEEKKVKTPTLKVKATSLDSSESANLSLPRKKAPDVPQNSISVPNTPKRQPVRTLAQHARLDKHDAGAKSAEQRRLYMKGQDSGIFLRENHASLMLYRPGPSRRAMGSFDENMSDFAEDPPEISVSGPARQDSGRTLGASLLDYKQNLSVSSTNLKTLPEGVTSDDFDTNEGDDKLVEKLHRKNSNRSLMLASAHSLQSSDCSLNSSGASGHNLTTVRTSISNFSLTSDNRKRLSLERRDSNASLMNTEQLAPASRAARSSSTGVSGEGSKSCLLQRRGSNNSLTLNILPSAGLSRHSSNNSLNKDPKFGQKKGLLERRSSNTSLTLNINGSNPQLSANRSLSVSNYNLNGSACNLSRHNSNQSVDNPPQPRRGILERRGSNASLTLNIRPEEPRDLEIDESLIDGSLKELPSRERHRKSLSTENLLPKSYRSRARRAGEEAAGFGSHDDLCSRAYSAERAAHTLTYVCGDPEDEIVYALGRRGDAPDCRGFVRNITTEPLSPQTTSEDFRLYLANMQHLQTASSVLTRQRLRDLNEVFQNGYSTVKCRGAAAGRHCCPNRVDAALAGDNPQTVLPDAAHPCSEYQKTLLRQLHQEFWDMPTNFQEKPIVSGSHAKNRYKTILPNEHSRFILKADAAGAGEGYINANFIKGHEYTRNSYIATQGPLQNTVRDFWAMVHQNAAAAAAAAPAAQKIVMLTNFVENNRQKCERYFPLERGEEMALEGSEADARRFLITNAGVIRKSGYTIRKLYCSAGGETVTVHHYWFHNWADHKCPKDVNALLNLSLDVLKETAYDFDAGAAPADAMCRCLPRSDSKFVFPPADGGSGASDVTVSASPLAPPREPRAPATVVHCSAGVGRTGCLIAILNGIRQLAAEHKVDVLGIVCNMRLNRGGMVQNSEQYELIHKVLCLFERACLPPL